MSKAWNKAKFALSSVCILLVGALAAGLAARAVVLPRAGEVFSAGVLNVPSVLGQTAEEVLFPPWPLYGTQNRVTLADLLNEELNVYLEYGEEAVESQRTYHVQTFYDRFLVPFSLFGVLLDAQAAFEHAEISAQRQRSLLFLKDFPAQSDSGGALTVSLAYSDTSPVSVSYLVRPANPQTLTEAQQTSALERVTDDLRDILTSEDTINALYDYAGPVESNVVYNEKKDAYDAEIEISGGTEIETVRIGNEMALLLSKYIAIAQENGSYSWPLTPISQCIAQQLGQFPSDASFDEILAYLDSVDLQIQIISTPEQIIVLFTYDSNAMMGVYYDIQLQQYSGLGLSYSSY